MTERLRRLAPWFFLALLTLFPRVSGIRFQIPMGDELRLLLHVARFSYGEALTSFQPGNSCIPLTLLAKLLADTIGLDELTLRLPVLLAGIATVLAVPLLARRYLASPWTLGALLALSPSLVFFSRQADRAALAALLAPLAILFLLHWTETRTPRHLMFYTAAAILCVYSQPISAPLVATPLLYLGLDRIWDGAVRRGAMRAGLAVVGGSALLLAVPAIRAGSLLSVRTGASPVTLASITGLGPYLFGTRDEVVQVALLALTGLGVLGLHRRVPRLVRTVMLAVAAQLIAGLFLDPRSGNPDVLFRNVIGIAPLLLLATTAGIERVLGQARLRGIGIAALLTGLLVIGPLPGLLTTPSKNFMGNSLFFFQPHFHDSVRVHPFYGRIAELGDEGAVLEVPFETRPSRSLLPTYQRVHGREVRVSWPQSNLRPSVKRWLANGDAARFRTLLDEGEIGDARDVAFVIHHKWELEGIPPVAGEVVFEDAELRVIRLAGGGPP